MSDQAGAALRPVDPDNPFGAAFFDAPHAVFDWLREHRPVARVRLPNGLDAWLVTRYEDVQSVLTDSRLTNDTRRYPDAWRDLDWSSPAGDMISAYGTSLSSVDVPEHGVLRALVAGAFTTRRAEELRPRVAGIAAELLADLPDEFDLLSRYAVPLSVTVMCELLGIPDRDRPVFVDFVRRTVADDAADVEALRVAAQRAFELVGGYVGERRREHHDDLMGSVVRAAQRRAMPDVDVVTFLFHLAVAGFDTTGAFIGNVVEGLLRDPGLSALVRTDRSAVPALVEEFLRAEGSARLGVWRFTTTEVEVGGTRIPEGELVVVALNSANRDEARFACPHAVDPARDARAHLAFGRGPHRCTGAALARVEAQVAIEVLVRAAPGLAFAVDPAGLRRRSVVTLNGRRSLPVRLGRAIPPS
ncbi:cytochrome P450 [Actinosynnema sp. NPDC047251]|uniref:Cytochrome P450 family protein n=1 Tax=Saccharothrix espanaensis (strain ATCC 51144 / DSM 44229 / JCM 9112 / NBRC 15066 / NRRL 15764) TaxID=1179773 RepID=K0K2Z8_SACES|nr:cytochrome P450 [Saccharothrix espanaensis]CCH32671.1 Cytochrome P450 family protein [Saccharothrix espanaensis DSM 44229]